MGQISQAYEVINGVHKDFHSPMYGFEKIDHYYLLNKSFDFPSTRLYKFYTEREYIVDSLAQYIPKEEILRMLLDTSFVGTTWKQKYLPKSKVVSEKKAKGLTSEKAAIKYNRKMARIEKKAETKPMNKSLTYYQNKFKTTCVRFSYPIFNSSKEYALVYLTDYEIKYVGCLYLCHLKNSKFDKILYMSRWDREL